jgi:AAA domain, putative AbiEii toxin, Type IV TA system/AAA ATPase domain
MYINSIDIKNIRSIAHFSMAFEKPAGWHVLIGDNGSGKSSVVRAISLALIGPYAMLALRFPVLDWIRKGTGEPAEILINISEDSVYDANYTWHGVRRVPNIHIEENSSVARSHNFDAGISIATEDLNGVKVGRIGYPGKDVLQAKPDESVWSGRDGWFSAAFGPFRRFTGGKEWEGKYFPNPRMEAHLSIFGEDIALSESLEWLQQLKFKSIEDNIEATVILEYLKIFINKGGLLPHGTQLIDVSSAGVFFKDGNGIDIDVTLLSDGFRSLLSMIFELIRQLVNTYGAEAVFNNVRNGQMNIGVPGVVLIDEVDAHLHPTWQTRIGQWFTKYFPNIQFIVTTHSPLVCRACGNGSIWRLAAPGSSIPSGQITGIDRDRLINGNILDAYGTEIFGQNVSIAAEASEKTDRLAELNIKSLMGEINDTETTELQNLKAIFPTQAL